MTGWRAPSSWAWDIACLRETSSTISGSGSTGRDAARHISRTVNNTANRLEEVRSMTGRLDNKVVLVSGGARGQGRSHAVTFAREGASVVVFDIAESLPGLFYELASEAD